MPRRGEGIFSYPPAAGDLEPFRLGSGDRGVLLIHGFCGTPPEMRGLGEHLAQKGFRVHGALLAGCGTTPEDLAATSWTDWIASAQAQLDELKRECRQVLVAGQSMGGAMSLILAARNPDVVALATCAALVDLGWWTELQLFLGRYLLKWHYPDRDNVDLWDKQAVRQLRTYNRRAMKSHIDLVHLYRQALQEAHDIKVPALIMHGMRDKTVPPGNAQMIAAAIGPTATVRYFERSGHAMTVDVDHDEIYQLIAEFFDKAGRAAPSKALEPSAAGG
ncbi:MAG TPA: alpha/beta fold hydrolase [Candidatus Solibacter sp.]|jgi:carboxylesterase|nr:alpha/beta fold hydrolase [Candidatus Solibacter sp.]